MSVKEQLMIKRNNKKKREIRNEYDVERSLKYIRFRISVDFIFDGFLKKKIRKKNKRIESSDV